MGWPAGIYVQWCISDTAIKPVICQSWAQPHRNMLITSEKSLSRSIPIASFPETICMIHEPFLIYFHLSGWKYCHKLLKQKESCDCQQQIKSLTIFLPSADKCPPVFAYEVASRPVSQYMQTCVASELREFLRAWKPWPPHYSPPRKSLKSDIVSLRFHLQSSAGLSIVGGTESELRLIYGGRRQVAHMISGPAAVRQQ